MVWFLAGCAVEPPPPPSVPLPAPLEVPACPPVPDAVLAAVAPARSAAVHELSDRLVRGGAGARCPWMEGPSGRGALLLFQGETPRVAAVRLWAGAPVEVLAVRPVPLDAERRIAASLGWKDEELAITWWDDLARPCVEWVSDEGAIHWTCPERPAPPVEQPIAWPDPVDRE